MSTSVTVLFRPVGLEELELIRAADNRAFPPRLPEQPIFYPVTTREYAEKIARDWNTKTGSGQGFVTRFAVETAYLEGFETHAAGGSAHREYWIPADELDAFNAHIVGKIEVVAAFSGVEVSA